MSSKPSEKTIARLNASTLFPEIKKGSVLSCSITHAIDIDTDILHVHVPLTCHRPEIEKNPSMYAIQGFYIFNITKKSAPMTEWYEKLTERVRACLLLQPAVGRIDYLSLSSSCVIP